MTRDQAEQIARELGDVLARHNVLFDDDMHAGFTLCEWVGEGPPPNPFRAIQFHGDGEWVDLNDGKRAYVTRTGLKLWLTEEQIVAEKAKEVP